MKPKQNSPLFVTPFVFFVVVVLGCSAESGFRNSVDSSQNQIVGAGAGGGVEVGDSGLVIPLWQGKNDAGTGVGTNSGDAAIGNQELCSDTKVQTTRVTPWVLFVVDRSGSTAEEFPGSDSKWQALYDALMEPNTGVIPTLQSQAYFGMVLYDGGEQNMGGWMNTLLCLFDPTACAPATTGTGAEACPRLL